MSTRSVLVLAGAPAWAGRAEALLAAGGFTVARCADPARLIACLVDVQPALVLVDGDADGLHSVAAIRAEQSTRRLPVLVVAADADQIAAARAAGADASVLVRDLDGGLLDSVRAHAHLADPATSAALACQCREALPPLARLGVRRFNAGAYYAQHDAFEEQWMAEAGPVRELYRAILQVGVAYYHLTRGNHAGALKMLRRSAQWFALLPDVCQGIDVRELREDAARVRAALEALAPDQIDTFDRSLLKPIRLVDP